MKKIAIVGAGAMVKPLADYFIDTCGYEIIILARSINKAETIIADRNLGTVVQWLDNDINVIDEVLEKVDLVVSMVPKPVHILVAEACLRKGVNMVTTAYEIPELLLLDKEAKEKGVLILNELGEVPGLDHFGTQMVLDEVREDGGRVISLNSYGSGLPSFEDNNNPMGYKFSWDPNTVFVAAKTAAAYLKEGKRIEVSGNKLFEHFWYVDIDGLGTFESYPNKDVQKYVLPFGLDENVSFYRGLLRYSGYCNNLKNMSDMGLLENISRNNFSETTYREFTSQLIGAESTIGLEEKVENFFDIEHNSDIIHRLKWLGFFEDKQIKIDEGTNLDILLDLMLGKMAYQPHEKDMIILHIDVLAEFPDGHREKRLATMVKKGIPNGDSAMSRAVALPAAISSKLIVEGKIKAAGLRMPPNLPELYKPVLKEMKNFGFEFKQKTLLL